MKLKMIICVVILSTLVSTAYAGKRINTQEERNDKIDKLINLYPENSKKQKDLIKAIDVLGLRNPKKNTPTNMRQVYNENDTVHEAEKLLIYSANKYLNKKALTSQGCPMII